MGISGSRISSSIVGSSYNLLVLNIVGLTQVGYWDRTRLTTTPNTRTREYTKLAVLNGIGILST